VNVKSLREAIGDIADVLAASGKGPRAQTLHAVLNLLEGHDDESLAQFLIGLPQRLSRQRRATGAQVNEPNPTTVAQYVRRLRETGTDRHAFDAVLYQLSTDRAVRKAEANAIAQAYTGGRPAWSTRRQALDAVKRWFGANAFNETKMRQVESASN